MVISLPTDADTEHTLYAGSTWSCNYLFPGLWARSPTESGESLQGQKGPPGFSASELLLTFATYFLYGRYYFVLSALLVLSPLTLNHPRKQVLVSGWVLWMDLLSFHATLCAAVRTCCEHFLQQGALLPEGPQQPIHPHGWEAPSVIACDRDTNTDSFLKDTDSSLDQLWFRDSQIPLLKLP